MSPDKVLEMFIEKIKSSLKKAKISARQEKPETPTRSSLKNLTIVFFKPFLLHFVGSEFGSNI